MNAFPLVYTVLRRLGFLIGRLKYGWSEAFRFYLWNFHGLAYTVYPLRPLLHGGNGKRAAA